MLNPKNNRLDYGSILSPPDNYQLDFAIASTYSLDLDSLVGASISLDSSGDIDSELNENPMYLLKSLRNTGNKIALFCECGEIKHPNKITPLYILLENSVFQVKNTNAIKNRYASFHPKTWLIRYINDEKDVLYRFIVLSRNLTFDRSWDLSFSMEGKISDKSREKNNPLIDFIGYLSHFLTDENKTHKINEIMEELKYIDFKLDSNIFEGFEFIIEGIDEKYSIKNQQIFKSNSLENLLIMSPFLSKNVINDFNSRKNPKTNAILISQLNSLSQLKNEKLDNFEFYALKDDVVDGESSISDDSAQISKQDIHAKMYVVEKVKYTDLYLGSLNASNNALNGNVEFMIKLRAKKSRFSINKLLGDIFNGGGAGNPFQFVDLEKIKTEESEDNNLNLIIKDIVRLDANAKIICNGDNYDIEIDFNKDYEGRGICIKPLLSNKTYEFSKKVIFKNLKRSQLSEFFVVSIKDEGDEIKRVIKIHIDNLPSDRQDDVLSSIINDKTAFIKYVAFLLGDEYVLTSIEDEMGGIAEIDNNNFTIQLPELYEKMLKAALYAPEKFTEIEFLIKTLSGGEAVPEGFDELYNTFKQVLNDE